MGGGRPRGATEDKTAKVNLEIDTSGSKPSRAVDGGDRAGQYDLSLIDEKNLVGNGDPDHEPGGSGATGIGR